MIGLLFIGAIAIWAVVALALGSKIPLWLGLKQHRVALGFAFALLLFVAPVADEIIAWPQMQLLCSNLQPLSLAEGMDEKRAYGRTVYYRDSYEPVQIFPRSVRLERHEGAYFDTNTHEKILSYHGYTPRHGFLSIPNGSSGGTMTAILKGCSGMKADSTGYSIEKYGADGFPIRFAKLNLKNTH